jgi:hypothetical protein
VDIIHLSAPCRSLGRVGVIALGLLTLPLLPGMASANDRSGQVLLVPESSGAVTADRGIGGADDPPGHDANDDNGVDPAGHDANDDNGVDPAGHDANDDHGVDPAGHNANDDHGGANGNSGSGNGGGSDSGHGGSDDHGGSSGNGNSGSQH